MTENIRITRQAGGAWQCPFSRPELATILDAMREVCGLEEVFLDLTITDDNAISQVNQNFLNCPGPTNILSFPPATNDGLGGASLVFSLDTLERECLLYGQDAAEHTLRLLAHGMAHLGGHDHGPAMDAVQDAAFVAGKSALSL